MTASHSILTVFAACSLLAAQAGAQTVATPAGPAAHRNTPALASTASVALKAPVALRGMATTHAATHTTTHTTTITAAGGVLLLADGIVADARIAPVPPPAPGFQYER